MEESTGGLIIFSTIAVISALLWHAVVKKYFMASFGSALTTVISFQLLAYINLGHVDPFIIIAVLITSVAALLVSLVIGIPFKQKRKCGNENPRSAT